jgi:cytochrome P450
VQIIAGSDSVATVMRITMLFLMTSPRCYEALTDEIAAGIRTGAIPSDEGAVVPDAVARNMPYLQAVIKEGLRVWPPVVGLMGVEVPPGGDVIHGFSVPGGTEIGVALAGVMRNKAVFGHDADLFRPERWIEASEADPDRYKTMVASWELCFKYGKWQCLGKTVALIELDKIFVEVSFRLLSRTRGSRRA